MAGQRLFVLAEQKRSPDARMLGHGEKFRIRPISASRSSLAMTSTTPYDASLSSARAIVAPRGVLLATFQSVFAGVVKPKPMNDHGVPGALCGICAMLSSTGADCAKAAAGSRAQAKASAR